MIALDSSALVAIALAEEEEDQFKAIISAERCVVGWPTLFETYLALNHRVDAAFASNFLRALMARSNCVGVGFDEALFEIARAAFDHFGRGHKAKLNFGDCMSYAVAKFHEVPLLFKGDDFRLTDIRAALP